MTLEAWGRVLDVSLTGQFIAAREAVRRFPEQGIDPTISPRRRQDLSVVGA